MEVEDDNRNVIGVDRVRLPFNNRMTEIFQGSDLNEIVNEMLTHMQMQIENPSLANDRFTVNDVLFLDINFYQMNLTQGSSYLPLPDWIVNKRAVISAKNVGNECFNQLVTAALHHHVGIKSNPDRISRLRNYVNNYNWS